MKECSWCYGSSQLPPPKGGGLPFQFSLRGWSPIGRPGSNWQRTTIGWLTSGKRPPNRPFQTAVAALRQFAPNATIIRLCLAAHKNILLYSIQCYIRVVFTQIQLKTETRDRLKEIGKKGESYDAIINRILDNEKRPGSPNSSPP